MNEDNEGKLGRDANFEGRKDMNEGLGDSNKDLNSPYASHKENVRYPTYREDSELKDSFSIGLIFRDTK